MHHSVCLSATTGPPSVYTVTVVGLWFFISEPGLSRMEQPILMQQLTGGDRWLFASMVRSTANEQVTPQRTDATVSSERTVHNSRCSISSMQILQLCSSSKRLSCCSKEIILVIRPGMLWGTQILHVASGKGSSVQVQIVAAGKPTRLLHDFL